MPIDTQKRDRDNIYDILRILIIEGKQEREILVSIIRTKLGIRHDKIMSDYIKPMYRADLINIEEKGNYEILFITNKGKQFLVEEEAKALPFVSKKEEEKGK